MPKAQPDKTPTVSVVVPVYNRPDRVAAIAGVRAAVGAYVAFLDSDDDWVPEKLAMLTARLLIPQTLWRQIQKLAP